MSRMSRFYWPLTSCALLLAQLGWPFPLFTQLLLLLVPWGLFWWAQRPLAAQAEHLPFHRLELAQAKLQADREHEEHHPEFGQRRQALDVGHQVERMWANDAAYSEITQHRWQVESAKQDDGKNRGSQQKQNKG